MYCRLRLWRWGSMPDGLQAVVQFDCGLVGGPAIMGALNSVTLVHGHFSPIGCRDARTNMGPRAGPVQCRRSCMMGRGAAPAMAAGFSEA